MIGVIEDSEQDIFLFRKNFGDAVFYKGFRAYMASKESHDVVISDINTGDYEHELLESCIQKEDCLFYIYTTAHRGFFSDSVIDRLKELGVLGIFQKNTDDDLLKKVISNVLSKEEKEAGLFKKSKQANR